jgi:hypothetical protein
MEHIQKSQEWDLMLSTNGPLQVIYDQDLNQFKIYDVCEKQPHLIDTIKDRENNAPYDKIKSILYYDSGNYVYIAESHRGTSIKAHTAWNLRIYQVIDEETYDDSFILKDPYIIDNQMFIQLERETEDFVYFWSTAFGTQKYKDAFLYFPYMIYHINHTVYKGQLSLQLPEDYMYDRYRHAVLSDVFYYVREGRLFSWDGYRTKNYELPFNIGFIVSGKKNLLIYEFSKEYGPYAIDPVKLFLFDPSTEQLIELINEPILGVNISFDDNYIIVDHIDDTVNLYRIDYDELMKDSN